MTFGRNPHGQLGLDNTTSQVTPQYVTALENVNIIGAACGRHHTLFLTDSGTVYACGDNKSGQCGVGNQQPQILVPTRINYRGPPIIKVLGRGGISFLSIMGSFQIKQNLFFLNLAYARCAWLYSVIIMAGMI